MIHKLTSILLSATLVTAQFSGDEPSTPITPLTTTQAPSPSQDLPPLQMYPKATTQFDGVTLEDTVTYLTLLSDTFVILPLASCQQVASPLDFTFKFWFKINSTSDLDPQQLFRFQDSVRCNFQGTVISCNTPERRPLSVDLSSSFVAGKWFHFSIAVTKTGNNATLSIWDNFQLIGEDFQTNFTLNQAVAKDWSVCFGQCGEDSHGLTRGFNGGIREVAAFNKFLLDESMQSNTKVFSYEPELKGYFRFQAQDERMFNLDQYRESIAVSQSNLTLGRDMISNNICPSTFETRSFVDFSGDQQIPLTLVNRALKQQGYSYTMSITLKNNYQTCNTTDIKKAASNCNIVFFQDVFMLYFTAPNVARFYFYAQKNYYESQSSQFFVPLNEWVTIQMTISQYDGYQVVVLNQEGRVVLNFSKKQNMQAQMAQGQIGLFSGFSGEASQFVLTDVKFSLPRNVFELTSSNPLLNIDITNLNSRNIKNKGSAQGLSLKISPQLKSSAYRMTNYGNLPVEFPTFDGIACNDLHMSLQLDKETSYFSFKTPQMNDWMSESTIQFWFKLNDWKIVQSKAQKTQSILQMVTPDKVTSYWFVFLRGGELNIAPFGLNKLSEPTIVFKDFTKENSDDLGWWHLSCYFQFFAQFECTLYNSINQFNDKMTLDGESKYFIPKDSLNAVFGKTTEQIFPGIENMMIKDIRYWNRKVLPTETKITRYQQLDPTQNPNLLSYYSLMTGLPQTKNLAQYNNIFNQTDFSGSTYLISVQSDYLVSTLKVYDDNILDFVSVDDYTYHNVCPMYTYKKGDSCYSDPVNQARLAIFPNWDESKKTLEWLFTLDHSNLISDDAISTIQATLSTDDTPTQSVLDKSGSVSSTSWSVPASSFRHQYNLKVTGSLSNNQSTFNAEQQIIFTPNKCQWFNVENFNAYTGRRDINLLPGLQDINFQLKLFKNPEVACKDFEYFDLFDRIEFEFIAVTDDDSYIAISDQPSVTYRAFSPTAVSSQQDVSQDDTNQSTTQNQTLDKAARSADDLILDVKIPQSEQYKIPVWTDIKILMSIYWTSSLANNGDYQFNTIFQHALYTIKYEPFDSQLVANLDSNRRFVQQGETLNLTASRSTVQGLAPSQVKNMLSYKWQCPTILQEYCDSQNRDTLYVPWTLVLQKKLNFTLNYDFGVFVKWQNPDGSVQTKFQQVTVQWFNLKKPVFQIKNKPDPILVTSSEPTEFSIVNQNFINATQFDIIWQITPPLRNPSSQTTRNNSLVMQIAPGSLKENTVYQIQAKVTYINEASIFGTQSFNFSTMAPPKNGTVIIKPEYGYVGDNFTVFVRNFSDPISAVFYNVFSTNDSLGKLKGQQFNQKSLAQNTNFTFVANSTNPIIVEVQNLKGERLQVLLKPWIVVRQQNCTNLTVCSQVNTTKNSSTNKNGTQSSNTTNGTQPANNSANETVCKLITTCVPIDFDFSQKPLEQESPDLPNTSNNSSSNETNTATNTSDGGLQNTGTGTDSGSPTNPNSGFSGTDSGSTTNPNSGFSGTDSGSTNNPNSGNSQTGSGNTTNTDSGSPSSGADSTTQARQPPPPQNPESISQPTPDQNPPPENKDKQTLKKKGKRNLLESEFEQLLQQSQYLNPDQIKNFCDRLVPALASSDLENKFDLTFAAYEQITDGISGICVLDAIIQQARIEDSSVSLINQVLTSLLKLKPKEANYKGSQIQLTSVVFNQETAANAQPIEIVTLDSIYTFDAQSLIDEFPEKPTEDLYMQAIAVKSIDFSTQVYLRLSDSVSGQTFDMNQLDGRTEIIFSINPAMYISGQTVCQGKLLSGQWSSSICLTEIDVQHKQAKCTCSMTAANMISFMNDKMIEVGSPLVFPVEPVAPEFKGISFFFLCIVASISILGLVGSLIMYRMDRKDIQNLQKFNGWRLEFIENVSTKLSQPIEQVKLRGNDLIEHYVTSQTTLAAIIKKIHPLFAPSCSFQPEQTRLNRFAAYYLQINIFVLACMIYFAPSYRQEDKFRQELFLDSADVNSVTLIATVGSVFLLPLMSSPFAALMSNKLIVSDQKVEIIRRRAVLRAVFNVLCLLVNMSTVGVAIWVCKKAPTTNQYLIASSIFLGLFLATFLTNFIRAIFIQFAPNNCLSSNLVRELLNDINVVNEVRMMKQFETIQSDETFKGKEIQPFEVCTDFTDRRFTLKDAQRPATFSEVKKRDYQSVV